MGAKHVPYKDHRPIIGSKSHIASGGSVAQMNHGVARTKGPDKEVRAAQQSLADAVEHLKKVRDSKGQTNTNVLELVEHARTALRYEDGAGP